MLQIPFSVDEFFGVFRAYNDAVWPMQWVLLVLGIATAVLAASRLPSKNRWISGCLGFLWAWMGFAYHLAQFTRINPAAYLFGLLFLSQAVLFLRYAWTAESPQYRFRTDFSGGLSAGLIFYALVGYPLLSAWLGHRYPAMPTFGVPCPTTLLTFGILSIAIGRGSGILLAIPVLWAAIGGSAAFLLDVPQDLGLIVAALLVLAARIRPRHATH